MQIVSNQEFVQEPLQAFELQQSAEQADVAVSMHVPEYVSRWRQVTATAGLVLALTGCAAKPHTSEGLPDLTTQTSSSASLSPTIPSHSSSVVASSETPSTVITTTPESSNTVVPTLEAPVSSGFESLPLPVDQSQFSVVINADGLIMRAVVHRKDVPLGQFYDPEVPDGDDWMDTSYSPNASPFPEWPKTTQLPTAVEGHKCHTKICPFSGMQYGEDDTGNVHIGTEVDFITANGTRKDEVCGVGLSPKKLPDGSPNPRLIVPTCEGQEIPDGIVVTCNIVEDPVTGKVTSGDNIVLLTKTVGTVPATS